mgnify:CR=1 FL=1
MRLSSATSGLKTPARPSSTSTASMSIAHVISATTSSNALSPMTFSTSRMNAFWRLNMRATVVCHYNKLSGVEKGATVWLNTGAKCIITKVVSDTELAAAPWSLWYVLIYRLLPKLAVRLRRNATKR